MKETCMPPHMDLNLVANLVANIGNTAYEIENIRPFGTNFIEIGI